MAIKIVIDSASDIGAREAEQLGVELLPMLVSFGSESFRDGIDLTPTEFYERLIESDELPKTSQVTPYEFEETFAKLTANGDQVIAITISSRLSGTFLAAKQAAAGFENKVWVVDSLNACVGERLLCQYALRLREQGVAAEALAQSLEVAKGKICVMAMINTLEYLKKGGRISAATAFAGELLSLKPVVAVVEGEVKMVGKAMGSKKGNNLLNRMVQENGGIDFSMPYGVVWSGLERTTLDKYLKDSATLWEKETEAVPAYILGGTIGTHIGPGAVGVAFFRK